MFSVVLRIIFSKINLFERVIKVLVKYKRKAPYSEYFYLLVIAVR